MLCIPIIGPTFELAKAQIEEALKYADLIEIRLDYCTEIKGFQLEQLRSIFNIPMIFTLRDQTQGGKYARSEDLRLTELRRYAKLKPEYMDIEFHVNPSFIAEITKEHPEIKIIISYHDFEKTPDDCVIEEIYRNMKKTSAFLYKMAFKAKNSLDALRLLEFQKTRGVDGNLVALSMGMDGQLTRILGPIFGNAITYASLEENQQTAPGQLDAHTLLDLYRIKSMNTETKIYGIIGYPLDQTFGHIIHNRLMKDQGINAVYVKIRIQADELGPFFEWAGKLGFSGVSITMPLKEACIPFIDCVEDEAKRIGAVNTVKFLNDKLYGYNTDGMGALNAIEKYGTVKDKRVVILGAGGTAKAIAYIALTKGANLQILNRDSKKAQLMAQSLADCLEIKENVVGASLEEIKTCFAAGYDILINCTPIPHPIDPLYIDPKAIVMDVSLRSRPDDLLDEAVKKGCRVVYGYEMWIEQALGQCAIWYGTDNRGVTRALLVFLCNNYF